MRHTRIIVTHYGGPDALRVVEEECPEPKAGEVQVSVLAAGVSLPDIMAREGGAFSAQILTHCSGWSLAAFVRGKTPVQPNPSLQRTRLRSPMNSGSSDRSFALAAERSLLPWLHIVEEVAAEPRPS